MDVDRYTRDWAGWNWGDRLVLASLAPVLALALLIAARRHADLPPPPEPPELRVDPNRDPVGVIEVLPGIGPTLADRIVEARQETPFRTPEDLDRRVRGIGPVKREAIRPMLRFDPDPPGRSP